MDTSVSSDAVENPVTAAAKEKKEKRVKDLEALGNKIMGAVLGWSKLHDIKPFDDAHHLWWAEQPRGDEIRTIEVNFPVEQGYDIYELYLRLDDIPDREPMVSGHWLQFMGNREFKFGPVHTKDVPTIRRRITAALQAASGIRKDIMYDIFPNRDAVLAFMPMVPKYLPEKKGGLLRRLFKKR